MKTPYSIALIFILLTACFSKEDENSEKTPNQVVLIFKDFPEDYSISLNDTKGQAYTPARPELRFYDDHLIPRILKPETGTNDTIRIGCNQKYIEFRHSVKGIDNFDYLFRKGDTIVFSYTDRIPIAEVTNRIASDFEINYDLRQREIVCNSDYPALTKVTMPFMFITYNSPYIGKEGERSGISGQLDKVKDNAQLRFKKEIDLEKNLLDSLLERSLISNDGHKLFSQKLRIKELTEKVYNDAILPDEIKAFMLPDADSLLRYHFYRSLLTNAVSTFYSRKVNRITSNNSNLPDYEVVCDSIRLSKLFSEKAKDILLFETTDLLFQNASVTRINGHLKNVESDIGDSVLFDYLGEKYRLKNPLSDEFLLVDFNGNRNTLMEILEEHTSNVAYVDIWASWCSPCIEEFPRSNILADRFKDRAVKFVYISIDDDFSKWKGASKKYGLPEQMSFLIENKSTSTFLESVNLSTIPRYLIFSKKGILEFENAPGPGDIKTIGLIEGLLTND